MENKGKKQKYNGEESNNFECRLNDYQIQPVIKDSKFNLFFCIAVYEIYTKFLSLAIYANEKFFFFIPLNNTYYKYYFIDEFIVNKKNSNIKYLMIQIPFKNKFTTINIQLKVNSKGSFNFKIQNKNQDENYFVTDYLHYDTNNNNGIIYNFDINELFTFYFDCFFTKEKNKDERLQMILIKALRYKISSTKITLTSENILKFFKYCFDFKLTLENITHIELSNEQKIEIAWNEKYKQIINSKVNENEKKAFLNLILKIFAIQKKEYLLELIDSKDSEIYYECIRNLIKENILEREDLKLLKKDTLLKYQEFILEKKCKTRKEIEEDLLKLFRGVVNAFKFIINNYKKIIDILRNDKKKEKYYLALPKLEKNDNLDDIYNLLKEIISLEKKNLHIKIIDYEKIFKDLLDLYLNDSLDELLKLKTIAQLFEGNKMHEDLTEKFYYNFHSKGMRLIEDRKMNLEEIIAFIDKKDIYYKDPKYIDKRDPKIFKNIIIVDTDVNYMKNIKILKENKIWHPYFYKNIEKL